MIPHFDDLATTRRWKAYFAQVDRLLALAGDDADELRGELQAHLADSFAAGDRHLPELARLEAAIARLGDPAQYLRPLVADALLDRGTRSYDPRPIARGLYHGFRAGSARALVAATFGLGYALLAAFSAMALLKPVWGDHVGLFRRGDGGISFGIVADPGGHELLGAWIVPIALAVAALLYVALTRALRRTRRG